MLFLNVQNYDFFFNYCISIIKISCSVHIIRQLYITEVSVTPPYKNSSLGIQHRTVFFALSTLQKASRPLKEQS